jgi:Repeat of unknown function (DUF5907)
MPLFVTVTPGTTVSASTTLDASTLNLLGTPSVDVTGTVDGGSVSITSGSVPLASLVAQANATIVGNGSGSSNSPVALNASADFAFTPTTMVINTNAVTTAKIANSNVTYAKIQDVSNDNRLLGRSGGGVNVAELTVGSGLTLSGGALTNGILRYTTSLKDIPTLAAGGRNIQWLESLGELPSITVVPQIVKVVLRCKTQQAPFEVGYEIPIESVLIQGFFDNRMVFCYQPCVNMGLVGGTDAFVNVWFATLNPGSPTFPWTGASAVSSQLVILDNTGVDMVIDTAKWQVKAYLLYAPTWA